MYQTLTVDVPISQGDIIDDCPIFAVAPDHPQDNGAMLPAAYRVRGVVLTQACDLAQAKTIRILVAVVYEAADLVAEGVLKAALIRD
jgi:hypothetical protein